MTLTLKVGDRLRVERAIGCLYAIGTEFTLMEFAPTLVNRNREILILVDFIVDNEPDCWYLSSLLQLIEGGTMSVVTHFAITPVMKRSCGHKRLDSDNVCKVCLAFPGRPRVTT